MLSIGAFAQIGQVTHRMLRHWDAAGLLVPAHVDERSGYRSYDPSQLERLHRIVALRQLGFGIEALGAILAEGIDAPEFAELLRERKDEVEREHRLAATRLIDVERRLQLIEKENQMSAIEIIEKPLPALRLAARRAVVAEQPDIAAVIEEMFDAVADLIRDECGSLSSPVAQYEVLPEGTLVIAGYAYEGSRREGFELIDLRAAPSAICGVHLGSMDQIASRWHALHEEIITRGYVPSGPRREAYIRAESPDQSDWVTELQQPVVRA